LYLKNESGLGLLGKPL